MPALVAVHHTPGSTRPPRRSSCSSSRRRSTLLLRALSLHAIARTTECGHTRSRGSRGECAPPSPAKLDSPLGALFYQGSPCAIGVTAYRSYCEAPQAPRTSTSIVDLHRYGVTVVAPGRRHHPTKTFPLQRHRDSHLPNDPFSISHPANGSRLIMEFNEGLVHKLDRSSFCSANCPRTGTSCPRC